MTSLGPATITPAVEVEILGARWAIEYDRSSQAGACVFADPCDVCQARHLADVIRDHDREHDPLRPTDVLQPEASDG